ncbi:hypothetical protein CIHG_08135 [Coccidioides immitis H538.4]|uniref:Uncharacterized protein n=1 Tax=Coccidioides immitis H538.4 TaxID=396776 RepID=A0A0J8S0E6_COCIT|nr:hypothetical protein CIHG_08135 [Coccidioides immitis H538.4]
MYFCRRDAVEREAVILLANLGTILNCAATKSSLRWIQPLVRYLAGRDAGAWLAGQNADTDHSQVFGLGGLVSLAPLPVADPLEGWTFPFSGGKAWLGASPSPPFPGGSPYTRAHHVPRSPTEPYRKFSEEAPSVQRASYSTINAYPPLRSFSARRQADRREWTQEMLSQNFKNAMRMFQTVRRLVTFEPGSCVGPTESSAAQKAILALKKVVEV